MLPPHSDHQSECLLHSLFLRCVSRGLLGLSHEDIINFDICAHRLYSMSCVSAHDIIHIRAKATIRVPLATRIRSRTELPRRIERAGRCEAAALVAEIFIRAWTRGHLNSVRITE